MVKAINKTKFDILSNEGKNSEIKYPKDTQHCKDNYLHIMT